MTTQEIANRLAGLCRKGDFETAQKKLFADDAVSIEPYASPAFEKETKGLQAIFKKEKKFQELVEEMYGNNVSAPLVAGNAIVLKGTMDVKNLLFIFL